MPADSLAYSRLEVEVARLARQQEEHRKQQEEIKWQHDAETMELCQQRNRSTQTTQDEIDIGKVRR